MLEDLPALPGEELTGGPEAIPALLAAKSVRAVTFEDWKRLDEMEVKRGEAIGKPREKFTTIAEMLAALE